MPKDALRVLLYCPHLGGHRPIYCRRLSEALACLGAEVYLLGFGYERGNGLRIFSETASPALEPLEENPRVFRIREANLDELFLDEFRFIESLKRRYRIDATLFVDGDSMIPFFLGLGRRRRRLSGKNAGFFIRSEFIHAPEGLAEEEAGADAPVARAFFRQAARGKGPLDFAFVADELLVEACGWAGCRHVPDIALPLEPEAPIRSASLLSKREEIEAFLARNKGRRPIVFFGDLEKRKGFEFVLRYCREKEDAALLRIGATKPSYTPTSIEDVWRKSELALEGRIYELDAFVGDMGFINYVLSKANYYLMPYERFYRTSALMLDLVARGKPVVVPREGLMGHRAEKWGLGLTFRPGDYADFRSKADLMARTFGDYSEALRVYSAQMDDEALQRALAPLADRACRPGPGCPERTLLGGSPAERLRIALQGARRGGEKAPRRRRALRRFIRLARTRRVAVFGGGDYALWLAAMTANRTDLRVVAVIDNRPDPDARLWGLAPEAASDFDPARADAIVLATEAFARPMREDCRRYFGRSVRAYTL